MGAEDSRRFPVVIQNQGPVFQKELRDVTGCILRSDETGQPINMFQKEMNDMLEDGRIRMIHKLNPGYVYFVTNEYDKQMFISDRDTGSEYPYTEYSVYFDEDFRTPKKPGWAIYRQRQ